MTTSLITCEIDLAAPGKQTGFLRVPHSVHSSAYGWLPIPIVTLKNGKGPTLLLMAGNHGDEYEGQIALTKLAQDLTPEKIQGRVLILPMTNAPAAEAGTRTSPIDQGNLNRSFPGKADGTVTEMIAHFIEKVLLPNADYSVDLHSGGTSLYYPATFMRGPGHTPAEDALLTKLQTAFDLPYAWNFTSGGGVGSTARTAMGAANRTGVINVMAELGGGGTLTPEILALTERGLRRILHALGMLPDYKPDAPRGTREMNSLGLIYAYESGLFAPLKNITDMVTKGEIVGHLHRPDTPWMAPAPITSPYDGMILAKRHLAQTKRGDALLQIVTDAEP